MVAKVSFWLQVAAVAKSMSTKILKLATMLLQMASGKEFQSIAAMVANGCYWPLMAAKYLNG